ncbi:MAG TPA: hypothetical protein VEG68_08830 [Terriglobales bacterium]|nr:hypothetical protein [Terriglobales bacterium]
MFNRAADALFRKDAGGRLIFLPRGPRKTGYYIDVASDEQKIKALVKLQVTAGMFLNLAGFLGSYTIASTWESLYFTHLPISIEARALRAGAVYLISAAVLQFTPVLILQKVYQRSLAEVCSTLQPAEPGLLGPLSGGSNPYRRVLVALAVAILLMGVLFAAVARRQVGKRHAPAKSVCPPTQPTQ